MFICRQEEQYKTLRIFLCQWQNETFWSPVKEKCDILLVCLYIYIYIYIWERERERERERESEMSKLFCVFRNKYIQESRSYISNTPTHTRAIEIPRICFRFPVQKDCKMSPVALTCLMGKLNSFANRANWSINNL